MPRNAAVSVGYLWGRPAKRTCGISVGAAARGQLPCVRRESIDFQIVTLGAVGDRGIVRRPDKYSMPWRDRGIEAAVAVGILCSRSSPLVGPAAG
jgi:hypothetical protein